MVGLENSCSYFIWCGLVLDDYSTIYLSCSTLLMLSSHSRKSDILADWQGQFQVSKSSVQHTVADSLQPQDKYSWRLWKIDMLLLFYHMIRRWWYSRTYICGVHNELITLFPEAGIHAYDSELVLTHASYISSAFVSYEISYSSVAATLDSSYFTLKVVHPSTGNYVGPRVQIRALEWLKWCIFRCGD